jgi:hypothetical protein
MCCDLTVANVLKEKTPAYRQTLLNTARELLSESLEPGLGLLGVFEEPFRLVPRLKWLEKKTWINRKWMFIAVFGVLLVMVPCILPMAEKSETTAPAALSQDKENILPDTGEEAVFTTDVGREKTYFLWKLTDTKVLEMNDAWIQENRIAYVQPDKDRTLLVDSEKMLFTYIDHKDESYVRFSIPPDMDKILSQDLRTERLNNQYTGMVRETENTRSILGKTCKEYHVSSWQVRGSLKTNKSDFKVWATTDVPFDIKPLQLLFQVLRFFYNRDEAFRNELEKIRGVQMRDEYVTKHFPWKKVYIDEQGEFLKKIPPEGIFEIPPDYVRKDRIEWDDLR